MSKSMDMRWVQERLRELRNIANDKYIKAIDEAINAIDENISYTDILWVMVTTYRELQEKFDTVYSENFCQNCGKDIITLEQAIDRLDELGWLKEHDKILTESVQSEIIKCGECKYAHITYSGEVKYCDFWETEDPIYMSADNFCSNAERREVTE